MQLVDPQVLAFQILRGLDNLSDFCYHRDPGTLIARIVEFLKGSLRYSELFDQADQAVTAVQSCNRWRGTRVHWSVEFGRDRVGRLNCKDCP
jgi:hypothetical protein